jgi:hypothetical protein
MKASSWRLALLLLCLSVCHGGELRTHLLPSLAGFVKSVVDVLLTCNSLSVTSVADAAPTRQVLQDDIGTDETPFAESPSPSPPPAGASPSSSPDLTLAEPPVHVAAMVVSLEDCSGPTQAGECCLQLRFVEGKG